MIKFKNDRLHKLLTDKDTLVKEGRKISGELEILEGKIKSYENKEKIITSKCEPEELIKKGNALNEEILEKTKELEAVIKEITDMKLASVPKDIKDNHMSLMKDREKLERDRNKVALKIQKIKDKAVPIIQKEVVPLLKEYDDIETAFVKGDEIVVETFNHLDNFKKSFKK